LLAGADRLRISMLDVDDNYISDDLLHELQAAPATDAEDYEDHLREASEVSCGRSGDARIAAHSSSVCSPLPSASERLALHLQPVGVHEERVVARPSGRARSCSISLASLRASASIGIRGTLLSRHG